MKKLLITMGVVLAVLVPSIAQYQKSSKRSAQTIRGISILRDDQRLNIRESLFSPNGEYELIMQEDGNLVLYHRTTNNATWSTKTTGQSVAAAVMQKDGNFVLYGYNGEVRWSSDTANHPGSFLTLNNEGFLIIYAGSKWIPKAIPPIFGDVFIYGKSILHRGQRLNVGESLPSPNGGYELILQEDGNLVLYHRTTNKPIWQTGPKVQGVVAAAVMDVRGNFMLCGYQNEIYWESLTGGLGGWFGEGASFLTLNDDGFLIFYKTTWQAPR